MSEVKSKEVKMKTAAGDNQETRQRLSYEQLNDACAQLYQQNQELTRQLRQMGNMFRRLDYLFRVLEIASNMSMDFKYSFDEEFVLDCIKEIQEGMSLPESTAKDAVREGD